MPGVQGSKPVKEIAKNKDKTKTATKSSPGPREERILDHPSASGALD
jgi:hypothetical protein